MTRQVELRWCGEEFPRWHADSSGNVYRDGVAVTPRLVEGYLRVAHGYRGSVRVHVLVATAFHGPRPIGMVCRHLNDIKTDNRACNLAWGTVAENNRDAVLNGRAVPPRPSPGELQPRAKLTNSQASEIRARYAQGGIRQKDLGAIYGVHQSQISRLLAGQAFCKEVSA